MVPDYIETARQAIYEKNIKAAREVLLERRDYLKQADRRPVDTIYAWIEIHADDSECVAVAQTENGPLLLVSPRRGIAESFTQLALGVQKRSPCIVRMVLRPFNAHLTTDPIRAISIQEGFQPRKTLPK